VSDSRIPVEDLVEWLDEYAESFAAIDWSSAPIEIIEEHRVRLQQAVDRLREEYL
jgi:hypothetical protein